jgi:hypothetical protein
MKIFISGSIKIKEIPLCAIEKLDSIIKHDYEILIGDAKGIDLLVQKYLKKKAYKKVTVYFAGEKIRNNIDNWQTKQIMSSKNEKGRNLYTLKDIEMAIDADYGLMIWDGESKGTLANIKEMKKRNKRFFVVMKDILILDEKVESIINMHLDNLHKQEIQGELF